MKIDGVWKVEMLGPTGWEARATAFLESGIYRAASPDHYTLGTYSVDGNSVTAKVTAYTYGQLRAMFGIADPRLNISITAEIDAESMTCEGKAIDPDGLFAAELRMRKLADL